MTVLSYNKNNTEGHHTTAFEFRGTELRKGEKAVTTRLANCYDVEIIEPQQDEVIKYDASKEKWVNGVGGGKCNVLTEDLVIIICHAKTLEN